MRFLSLFSGGGLGDYGLELAGMTCVGQIEIDDYCQKILALRWPTVHKWRDIREVKGKEVLEKCGRIDLVSGGFPCQPHSFAGKRKGAEDDRNLWPEMSRVISEVRPAWVLAENVPGVLGFAERFVLPDLESAGYQTLTIIFPAHALGAPHRRDRVWIVAYARHRSRRNFQPSKGRKAKAEKWSTDYGSAYGSSQQYDHVANTKSTGWKRNDTEGDQCTKGRFAKFSKILRDSPSTGLPDWADGEVEQPSPLTEFERPSGREIERDFCGVAHGVSKRVDRLKLLGNGQVVQVVQWIGERILRFDAMVAKR